MPRPAPTTAQAPLQTLIHLGEQIRARRKALRISATVAAEAAGISRVTLHRIEQGNPSVTIGAYANAVAALGLEMGVIPDRPIEVESAREAQEGWIPARIALADYPQLKQLAWQVHGTESLTPMEALGIYERNARHLDLQALEPRERHLIDALRLALADSRRDV